jgi:hypothetical protein
MMVGHRFCFLLFVSSDDIDADRGVALPFGCSLAVVCDSSSCRDSRGVFSDALGDSGLDDMVVVF